MDLCRFINVHISNNSAGFIGSKALRIAFAVKTQIMAISIKDGTEKWLYLMPSIRKKWLYLRSRLLIGKTFIWEGAMAIFLFEKIALTRQIWSVTTNESCAMQTGFSPKPFAGIDQSQTIFDPIGFAGWLVIRHL
jgi:hypothetical protein